MTFLLKYTAAHSHLLNCTLRTPVLQSRALPDRSTLHHVPDHIPLVIHFVCSHFFFGRLDFIIPVSKIRSIPFWISLSTFTYHRFCSNIDMLHFQKLNSYQEIDHLSKGSNTVSIDKLLHTWETRSSPCFPNTDSYQRLILQVFMQS